MTKKKTTKQQQEKAWNRFVPALVSYLDEIGWNVAVVGVDGITQEEFQFNHKLIISFTGSQKKTEDKNA